MNYPEKRIYSPDVGSDIEQDASMKFRVCYDPTDPDLGPSGWTTGFLSIDGAGKPYLRPNESGECRAPYLFIGSSWRDHVVIHDNDPDYHYDDGKSVLVIQISTNGS